VHLARQPNGANGLRLDAALRDRRTDGANGSLPPVGRILFGPGRTRRRERDVRVRRRRQDGAGVVYDERTRAARADVDTKNRNG
jgi:hypothetical protein